MVAMLGVAAIQFGSRPVYDALSGAAPAHVYSGLFLFFAVPLLVALALYVLSPEAPAT